MSWKQCFKREKRKKFIEEIRNKKHFYSQLDWQSKHHNKYGLCVVSFTLYKLFRVSSIDCIHAYQSLNFRSLAMSAEDTTKKSKVIGIYIYGLTAIMTLVMSKWNK